MELLSKWHTSPCGIVAPCHAEIQGPLMELTISWPETESLGPAHTQVTWLTADGRTYVGETAIKLIKEHGILPDPTPGQAATTGFSEQEQKWWGWSHRACYGFGIGDKVDSEDHCCRHSGWTDEYLADHPDEDKRLPLGFEAKTLDDCRRMAESFAESVG